MKQIIIDLREGEELRNRDLVRIEKALEGLGQDIRVLSTPKQRESRSSRANRLIKEGLGDRVIQRRKDHLIQMWRAFWAALTRGVK